MRALAFALLVFLAPTAYAQTRPQDMPLDLWNAFKQQAAPEGWVTVAGTAGLYAIARPHDDTVQSDLTSRPPMPQSYVNAGSWGGEGVVLFPLMGAVYGAGWAAGSGPTQEAGAMGLEALALAGIEVEVLKYAAQRERPNHADHFSFPSGHAAESFSLATTLALQFGWTAGVPAYLAAGFVGYSRLQQNEHWLSDVVVGAGLGVWCGRATWRAHRGADRIVFAPWIAPGKRGVLLSTKF